MMDSLPARNMQKTLENKLLEIVHLVGFCCGNLSLPFSQIQTVCGLLLIHGILQVLRLKADFFRYRRKLYGLNIFIAISVHLKVAVLVGT
jgi:hypothetical protein